MPGRNGSAILLADARTIFQNAIKTSPEVRSKSGVLSKRAAVCTQPSKPCVLSERQFVQCASSLQHLALEPLCVHCASSLFCLAL